MAFIYYTVFDYPIFIDCDHILAARTWGSFYLLQNYGRMYTEARTKSLKIFEVVYFMSEWVVYSKVG
jgi:hypothetical protein